MGHECIQVGVRVGECMRAGDRANVQVCGRSDIATSIRTRGFAADFVAEGGSEGGRSMALPDRTKKNR